MAEASDPQDVTPAALQDLMDGFAASGYAPEGATIEEHEPEGHEMPGHGHGAGPSVREFEHRGHRVRIITQYDVTIDGERWEQSMQVHNDGSVTYHGLPQYAVPSAVDLVKAVIDNSYEAPDDIRATVEAARREE